jgi:hypothetical protein
MERFQLYILLVETTKILPDDVVEIHRPKGNRRLPGRVCLYVN